MIDRKGKKSESPMNCSPWPKPSGGGFLIPADVHAEFLFNKLFPMKGAEREKPHGAIVIAGATGCGKSVFASAFALRVMRYHIDQARSSNERFPHLVTYEDPIEGWNLKVGKGKKETTLDFTKSEDCLEYGFCVTSRQKTIDVKSLCAALLDARRQTPQCFYVGELRRPSEWKHVMDFAGSGHLIVVTTHAASVGESMSKILSGCHAKTPADRRQWAGFLRGIVHLEKPSVKYGNAKSEDIVLPSLWRGIGSARNSLVSTGLSSVIPNPQFFDSRVAYFESLLKTFRDRSSLNRVRDPRWNEAIKSKALELDTRELTQ